ncbi:MAG: TIGR00296 family protein [archaeon]|nr:TIGR00296 family protein [archaeon]
MPRQDSIFSAEDGHLLVSSAREAITNFLVSRQIIVPKCLLSDSRFENKLGCFVTLRLNDEEKSLRGCIGFPEPVYKLSKALTEAAIGSATQDPRFRPVSIEEMKSLLVEVSVLTIPTLILVKSSRDLPSQIKLGKDGLIMRWSFGAGLLLPQVATEQMWDAEEFLVNLSMKAGAPPDQWLVPGTQVLKFQAQIFGEDEPSGKVRIIQ